jgi:hypothetical protein
VTHDLFLVNNLKESFMRSLYVALLLAISFSVMADEGPLMNPLKVDQIHVGDTANRIFVKFNANSMPGCFESAAGRLYIDNPFFNAIYSNILLLSINDGMRGRVIYVVDGSPGWSQCRILGFDLRP